jgi:D-alanine-D-alanine ligase
VSTRVGLVFGGRSVEHEVSVQSARAVAAAMRETDLECLPLAVGRDGRWLDPQRSGELLEREAAAIELAADGGPTVAFEPGRPSLLLVDERSQTAGRVDVDVIFPLIHGWSGEDGRLQGALELTGIPYVGSGVLASACSRPEACPCAAGER